MKKYFVKSHFSGWQEVNEEHFNAFIKNIKDNASNLKGTKKIEYIKTVTRIEEHENA